MTFDNPAAVMRKLTEIEEDLAIRQNGYEAAARWALALLTSEKASVTEKKAEGDLAAYDVEGASAEAEYEALRVAVRMLETRATIGMSILKAQGRG